MDFSLDTHPDRYRHWQLHIEGDTARLALSVSEDAPFRPGYVLKLNSYDLGVDIELADCVSRLRFEHPEVRCVVLTSAKERVFSAGANIHMLASSSHPFKVNFCKLTNETRLAIEDASQRSGIKWLAALNGACAGGGYELAMACDEILLCDDGSSTVSLPEAPILGVLPGTGGLTRLVDKRKVRRDHADVFATLAEGVKGQRALDWRLVDALVPRSAFAAAVREQSSRLAALASPTVKDGPGVILDPLAPAVTEDAITYRHVTVSLNRAARTAQLTVTAPSAPPPTTAEVIRHRGASFWPLRAFRELDDALVRLRFAHEELGVVTLHTRGDAATVLAYDELLATQADDWLVREVVLQMARTLRRLEATARSFFAIIDEGSCFAGSLLELALAADRSYMLDDGLGKVTLQASKLQGGALPMANGLSRLASRFLHAPARVPEVLGRAAAAPVLARDAAALGLCTVCADEIDFADEVRVAVEERASLSPDALTGLEQNLRYAGPETLETKIFGRLSAWQNWIFIRPNATGPEGALTLYGKPERSRFDPRRT